MKTLLIVIALVLLGFFAVLGLRRERPDPPEESSSAEISGEPSFRVRLVMPSSARALFGILPAWIEDRLEGATPRELAFDHKSRGAAVGSLATDRLELRDDDGWHLWIETDAEGRIGPATHLIFPIYLGERHVKLRCRPAEPAVGYLRNQPAGAGKLGGTFLVELATCKNADSGKKGRLAAGAARAERELRSSDERYNGHEVIYDQPFVYSRGMACRRRLVVGPGRDRRSGLGGDFGFARR